MVVNKIIGLVLLLFGIFTLKYFPDMRDYQPRQFTVTGILIGVIMGLIGIGLILFG